MMILTVAEKGHTNLKATTRVQELAAEVSSTMDVAKNGGVHNLLVKETCCVFDKFTNLELLLFLCVKQC